MRYCPRLKPLGRWVGPYARDCGLQRRGPCLPIAGADSRRIPGTLNAEYLQYCVRLPSPSPQKNPRASYFRKRTFLS